MDKYRAFINSIIQKYNKWSIESEGHMWDFDNTFTMEEQTIIHLNRQVECADGLLNGQDEKIVNKDNQIAKLWEHIDCLENNPFRRIYNWVVSIVKYRIKLVKIGDNK